MAFTSHWLVLVMSVPPQCTMVFATLESIFVFLSTEDLMVRMTNLFFPVRWFLKPVCTQDIFTTSHNWLKHAAYEHFFLHRSRHLVVLCQAK